MAWGAAAAGIASGVGAALGAAANIYSATKQAETANKQLEQQQKQAEQQQKNLEKAEAKQNEATNAAAATSTNFAEQAKEGDKLEEGSLSGGLSGGSLTSPELPLARQ